MRLAIIRIPKKSSVCISVSSSYIHDQWESDYCLTPTLQFFSYSLYHLIHDGDKSIHNNMENFKRQLDMLF
jgi:hypothetical protein